jgi:hypothetical protein
MRVSNLSQSGACSTEEDAENVSSDDDGTASEPEKGLHGLKALALHTRMLTYPFLSWLPRNRKWH